MYSFICLILSQDPQGTFKALVSLSGVCANCSLL